MSSRPLAREAEQLIVLGQNSATSIIIRSILELIHSPDQVSFAVVAAANCSDDVFKCFFGALELFTYFDRLFGQISLLLRHLTAVLLLEVVRVDSERQFYKLVN